VTDFEVAGIKGDFFIGIARLEPAISCTENPEPEEDA
jgi:hypothetical protein